MLQCKKSLKAPNRVQVKEKTCGWAYQEIVFVHYVLVGLMTNPHIILDGNIRAGQNACKTSSII